MCSWFADADGALEAFVSVITGPPGDRPEVLMDRIPGPMLILWGAPGMLAVLEANCVVQ